MIADVQELTVSRWTRLRLWRKHRRLHRHLQNVAAGLAVHGEVYCMHCRHAWRSLGNGIVVPFKAPR